MVECRGFYLILVVYLFLLICFLPFSSNHMKYTTTILYVGTIRRYDVSFSGKDCNDCTDPTICKLGSATIAAKAGFREGGTENG